MHKLYTNIFLSIFLNMFALTMYSQNIIHAGVDWADTSIISLDHNKKSSFMTAGCGTPFITTGYPLWTNYWAGWMVNIININACPIIINSFEARFQGTTGYRIYTKTNTFVGFETTGGVWTLVGTLASLTGTSTTAPTAIPIAVNVTIPSGGTQAFYLSRSDNVIANRHLYVPGAGTSGITIYATDGNLSITEGSYVDPYFAALQVGVRRPSFDACYTINCPLPIELISFDGIVTGDKNNIHWKCATETNNDYFLLERSEDGISFNEVARIKGAGNSNQLTSYSFSDTNFSKIVNYYRLVQVDFNGKVEIFDIIAIDNSDTKIPTVVKRITVLGTEVGDSYEGVYIEIYSNGTYIKKCCIPNNIRN